MVTRFLDGDGAMGMRMGMRVAVDAAPIRPISAMMMSRARRQSSRQSVGRFGPRVAGKSRFLTGGNAGYLGLARRGPGLARAAGSATISRSALSLLRKTARAARDRVARFPRIRPRVEPQYRPSREGLRVGESICSEPFVARQIEETEPRSVASPWPGRRGSVDAGGGSRAAETRAAAKNGLR